MSRAKSLILALCVIAALRSPALALSADLDEAAHNILRDYARYNDQFPGEHSRTLAPILVLAAAISGETVATIRERQVVLDGRFGAGAKSEVSGWLAAASVISKKPVAEIFNLFHALSKPDEGPEGEALAELTFGAAISGNSPEQIRKLFKEIRGRSDAPYSFGSASLAAAAAISRQSAADMIKLYQFTSDPGQKDLREAIAVLAAGAAHSGRSMDELAKLFAKISFEPATRSILSARQTSILAYAAAVSIDFKEKRDITDRLNHPAAPARAGENNTAEDAFRLNWLNHFGGL